MALASKPPTVLQGTDKITRENSSSMATNWDHRIHPSSSHGVPWNTRKWQEWYKEKEENAEPQGQDILESRIQEQKMLHLSFSSTLQIPVLNQSIIEKCAVWLQFSHLEKQNPADRLDHWTLQTTIFPDTLWRRANPDQSSHETKREGRGPKLNSKQEPRRSRVEE